MKMNLTLEMIRTSRTRMLISLELEQLTAHLMNVGEEGEGGSGREGSACVHACMRACIHMNRGCFREALSCTAGLLKVSHILLATWLARIALRSGV